MSERQEFRVRVYPTGPVGEPIAGYVAEVGEPLTEVAWAVFADSSPSEPTKRKAIQALQERLERRLVGTLDALAALHALGGRLP